jgi:hypothetical protein
MKNAYKILVGKPDERRQLERPTVGCKDNIKLNLKKWGLDSVKARSCTTKLVNTT